MKLFNKFLFVVLTGINGLQAMDVPITVFKDQDKNIYDFLPTLVDTYLPDTPKKSPRKPLAPLVANAHHLKRQLFPDDIDSVIAFDFEKVLMTGTELAHLDSTVQEQNSESFDTSVADAATTETPKTRKRAKRGEKVEHKCMATGCDKSCKSLSLLKQHQLTHTNERPFACSTCDYRAKTEIALSLHNKSGAHRAAKYTTPSSLQNPFVCQQTGCGAAFTNAKDHVAHLITGHPDALKHAQRKGSTAKLLTKNNQLNEGIIK